MATITESEHILILTSSSQFSTFRSIFNEYFEMNPEEKKSLIAICSNIDKSSSNIPVLYQDTTNILKKLFYYKSNTNLIDIIQIKSSLAALPNDLNIITLINDIISYIYQLNYAGVKESFLNLHYFLLSKQPPQDTIGYMLSNCYMQILTSLSSKYAFIESELPTVNEFTAHLCTEPYLFDHFEYITKQFSKAINSIKTNDKQNPCDKICKYIEVNASEPLKLETIAELFGYNSAYLGKLFYKETGTHFNTYLNQIRINHAKSYLQKGLSISQTCKKSGFTDTDYFTKKFKKYVGMLPSAFRKQNQ